MADEAYERFQEAVISHTVEARKEAEAKLEVAVALLREALPILQPDAPLRHYVNDAVRDRIARFLKEKQDG